MSCTSVFLRSAEHQQHTSCFWSEGQNVPPEINLACSCTLSQYWWTLDYNLIKGPPRKGTGTLSSRSYATVDPSCRMQTRKKQGEGLCRQAQSAVGASQVPSTFEACGSCHQATHRLCIRFTHRYVWRDPVAIDSQCRPDILQRSLPNFCGPRL